MRQQSEAQILGRLGERWFQAQLPSMWLFNPPREDFGVDGTVAIGDPASVTPYEFGVQVKTSRRWPRHTDQVVIRGIPITTVRYWAARLLPTLLILYEAESGLGFFGWVSTLLRRDRPISANTRTITLRIPESQRIDDGCWKQIEEEAIGYHAGLASASWTLDNTRAVLTTVHTLAATLRVLLTPPRGHLLEEQNLRMDIEATGHREVVHAIRGLANRFPQESDFHQELAIAAEAYVSICSDFIGNFEELLAAVGPVVIWTNPEITEASRPRLVDILVSLIVGLSGIASRWVPEGGHGSAE